MNLPLDSRFTGGRKGSESNFLKNHARSTVVEFAVRWNTVRSIGEGHQVKVDKEIVMNRYSFLAAACAVSVFGFAGCDDAKTTTPNTTTPPSVQTTEMERKAENASDAAKANAEAAKDNAKEAAEATKDAADSAAKDAKANAEATKDAVKDAADANKKEADKAAEALKDAAK